MQINFRKALAAGIVGTAAFDIVGFLLTGTFWDIPTLLGSKLLGEGGLVVGVVAHNVIGFVLAVIYAGLVSSLPGNRWLRALTYVSAETVIGVWFFMMPLLGIGVMGLEAGALVPLIALVRHWAYGLVLVAFYPVEEQAAKVTAPEHDCTATVSPQVA